MIWESAYWKEPLLEAARVILSLSQATKLTDDQIGLIEYKVLTGFFSVRKLLEAGTKLSIETSTYAVSFKRAAILHEAKNSGRTPDKFTRHQIDLFYDFSRTHETITSLGYLANQFVHSYILEIRYQRSTGWSFLVSSDKDKSKFCNIVQLSDIASIFEIVGSDNPSSLELMRGKDGDWIQTDIKK